MQGIIIYKSNYGSTRQYATWISEETGYPAVDVKKVKKKDILSADVVIFGCPIFAERPLLAGYINKKWKILEGKKVVLFTTSGTLPEHPSLQKGFQKNFKPEIAAGIRFFPQGGRMVFSQLNSLHRFLMEMGKKMEKNPQIRAEMGMDKDNVNREGLKPLLDYLH